MIKTPDISRRLFGGVLDYDGAGYYPGLELLNFVYCSDDAPLPPGDSQAKIRRRAHNFARQLVWDESFVDNPDLRNILFDKSSEDAIRHLLRCLQVGIPSLAKSPSWERAHFFPYSPSLIHWDARRGRAGSNRIRIERRYFRGAGALAHRVLRLDPDKSRYDRCRAGFNQLFPEGQTALERLAKVLLDKGESDTSAQADELEGESEARNDDHEVLFRNGVVNILEHTELSVVARVRALLNFTAFWLVLIQHRRASAYLGRQPSFIVADCGATHPQLRRVSQRSLKDLQQTIVEASEKGAEGEQWPRQGKHRIRGFFWATAATIGLLNAWTGRRHFTLGISVIETLVLAATQGVNEMPFEQFIDEWLYGQCAIVVGRQAAERSGLLNALDASIFEDNEARLAVQMKAAGFLTEYSDATKMIGTGGMR